MLEHISKDIVLTDEYWDCECDDNYIHPASQQCCDICGATQNDSPSSHYNEVIAAGLSVLHHNDIEKGQKRNFMNIKDIILEKMNAVGADGLCCFVGAIYGLGCGADDLFPCLEVDPSSCRLGKAVLIKDYCKPEDCEKCYKPCDGYSKACRTNAVIYVPMEIGTINQREEQNDE